jgi:hypothetical protein
MSEISKKQLLEWKARIEVEIRETEQRIAPLTEELRGLREKHQAIQSLIGPAPNGAPTAEVTPSNGMLPPGKSTESRRQNRFAPAGAYWLPILESLIDLGGRSDSDSVLNSVQRKMTGILTTADLHTLPSGISVRWRNRAQWQRKNMANIGLMRDDSPRGIWEITDSGRQFVTRNHRNGNN